MAENICVKIFCIFSYAYFSKSDLQQKHIFQCSSNNLYKVFQSKFWWTLLIFVIVVYEGIQKPRAILSAKLTHRGGGLHTPNHHILCSLTNPADSNKHIPKPVNELNSDLTCVEHTTAPLPSCSHSWGVLLRSYAQG